MFPNTRFKVVTKESTITKGSKLGAGYFGEVFKGVVDNKTEVALKTLHQGKDTNAFLREIKITMDLCHPNLIPLYGVWMKDTTIFLITELMAEGSVFDYLRGKGQNAPLNKLIDMAVQTAAGMAYLESKNYIHRDLAARNVLLGTGNIIKVADFGLARILEEDANYYQASSNKYFPVLWTAPEAASHGKYSIKSDVWSFGIFLMEIITHGGNPYPGIPLHELVHKLEGGYRMPKPHGCPEALYSIMLDCWHKDPKKRPSFKTLQDKIKQQ